MFSEEYQNYVNELGQVLRRRDLSALKEFYIKWKEKMELGPLPSDEALEAQMHQMICEFPSLADLHAESQKWLLEHGFTPQVEQSEKKRN
ncbi:MAG: hypothetical protein L0Z48_04640 [candidate division Zixibacteria bacterium]|nr:hypothetical protein [candidate division Zixibacteria bacterium]